MQNPEEREERAVERTAPVPGGIPTEVRSTARKVGDWFKNNWRNISIAVLAIAIIVMAPMLASARANTSSEVAALRSTVNDYQAKNTALLQQVAAKEGIIASQQSKIDSLQSLLGKGAPAAAAAVTQSTAVTTATTSAPSISKMVNQADVMNVLRQTFPECRIRGPERKQYGVISLSEVQRFLNSDQGDKLALGEDSDYVAYLQGAIKSQPGWDTIPVGFVKPTRTNPVFSIILAESGGVVKVYGVDVRADRVWPIENDPSAEFIVVLF
ncbi:MAG: hypothetical protein PHW72_01345 [Candidatus Pacebacteria bacterium]|nr:hypothetical protein [Candidatus Paceibacterota bacterium]